MFLVKNMKINNVILHNFSKYGNYFFIFPSLLFFYATKTILKNNVISFTVDDAWITIGNAELILHGGIDC